MVAHVLGKLTKTPVQDGVANRQPRLAFCVCGAPTKTAKV